MRLLGILFCAIILLVACQFQQVQNDYLVIAGKNITIDTAWNNVVNTLVKKHKAAFLSYNESIDELMLKIREINPRYVAIVEKPENIGRDYIINLNRLSRKIDDDIYADFLWGIITGYDAKAALRMVDNSTKPLVVKNAVATITELSTGKWFDRFAWIDDHKEGLWGEKKSKKDTVERHMMQTKLAWCRMYGPDGKIIEKMMPRVYPESMMNTFYDIYAEYEPDLLVTAAHATERNLEMPFSLGNVKSTNGILHLSYLDGSIRELKESGKRKIYLPIGNCLIGNVNNTKESMAIAWMNSGNAATMVGYVVTTWYGRNGWGGLKYWLANSGRYTAAEAFYLNQQDMMYQMNEWNPKFTTLNYCYDAKDELGKGAKLIMDSIGIEATRHHLGFLHDRDVLAFYGDPKWDVRLQEIEGEHDFTVTSEIKDKKCIVTIKTMANFSLERMKGSHFKQEHVLDLPFSYFFPSRLKNPRLSEGQEWKVALDENFLLIYNANFKPGNSYQVIIDID